MSARKPPNTSKKVNPQPQKPFPEASHQTAPEQVGSRTTAAHEPESSRTRKDPFNLDWKSLGIGGLVGSLLFLFLLGIGAIPTEIDLFGVKFNLPDFTNATPVPNNSATIQDAADDPLLGVALTGMKYMAGSWDPHSIDLTSAASEGIIVNEGYSLRLYDLWVAVPPDVKGYTGQLEVYTLGEVIGRSDLLELQPGGTLFNEILPTNYKHADVANAWRYDSTWETIDVSLIAYKDGQPVGGAVVARLLVNKAGMAWYNTPPYAHIVSIVYHVNNGPQKALDLRIAPYQGLEAVPGDSLTIEQIWCKSDMNDNQHSMQVESYLSTGQYTSDTSRISNFITFKKGSYDLLGDTDFYWDVITDDKEYLIITLVRDDSTVIDRYVLSLNADAQSGLFLEAASTPEQ